MNDQGTEAWLLERLGHVSASRMADVMATIKSGEAASRANYRAELVAQRLTGKIEESFTNGDMQRGTELEPFARTEYELRFNRMVMETGFVKHPTIKWYGCSPDGLVDDEGLVEIKAPKTATHISYLLSKEAPTKYQPQMLCQMHVTGRKWCDFVSYCPDLPDNLKLFVVRFYRDEERIKAMESEVIKFIGEVDALIKRLKEPTASDYLGTP